MNFIHNITLNFNEDLYEPYEWEKTDKLIYVKKIPIFKLSKKEYFEIKNNYVKFNKEFLNTIHKQRQLLKNDKKYNYIFLIACEEEVLAIELDKDGITRKKSNLLFEEIKQVLRSVNKLNKTPLEFTFLKKHTLDPYLTRIEKEEITNVLSGLKKLYHKNDIEKLSYLYLECFNKSQKNKDIIISDLKNEIMNKSEIFNKTVDFFKLIKQNL